MINNLNIGIVGGSIAGCSAAILLRRAGHKVQVFERSRGGLVGRGGGIGTSGPVFESLIAEDVIDAGLPHLTGTSMPFTVRTPGRERLGYTPWEMPINLKAFHWSALWNNLRKRVPDEYYHRGHQVAGFKNKGEATVSLQFEHGTEADFDLVIFADGYQSLGRRLLFPNVDLKYRGYMLWRGLLPEGEMPDSAPLGSNVPRLSYAKMPGNFVIYLVPGEDGSIVPGQRLYNWAAYIPIPEPELPAFMVGSDGRQYEGAIPPGKVRLEEEKRLQQLMADNLPGYYGDIVNRTSNTYVQLIYTTRLSAYHQGRCCLIGDAGMVAQPFTGSGVFKGYTNIKDLLQALENFDHLDDALQHWGKEQLRIGHRLLALGEQMEQAFIWNSLDLSTADAAMTEAWWRASVTFPEEFTYEAED